MTAATEAPVSAIEMVAVCSARPRPSVQNNHSRGNQFWRRDVYHLRRNGTANRTRCGLDCSEWLVIGHLDEVDDNCCSRCLSAVSKGNSHD
jgi:hypothetical protein